MSRWASTSPAATLLVVAIRVYRVVATRLERSRACLYRESCSRHVERVTRERGFRFGFAAMRDRFAACRPGYTFEFDDRTWQLVSRDGIVVEAADVAPALQAEARMCGVPVDRLSGPAIAA